MKKALSLILLFFLITTVAVAQRSQIDRVNQETLYDDWPVTVESNALPKSRGVTPSFVPIGTTWDHRIITYFFQNGTGDLAGDTEHQAIRDGFALWSAQTNLRFLEVCNAADADIVLLWGSLNHGDSGPFDGAGGVLAHTLGGPPPNGFGAQAGDIHFDDGETWTSATRNNNAQPIDLVTVAAHEIGHALGLDHTNISGSLMLSNYTGSHRFLGSDDIAGIRSLYGYPFTNVLITGASAVCSSTGLYELSDTPPNTAITWQVTPGNLFTTSSGTGSSASLTAVSSTAFGYATLTFTLNSGCGNPLQIQRQLWVGKPRIASAQLTDGRLIGWATTNNVCNLVQYTTAVSGDGNTSTTWTRTFASPTNTSWSVNNNNVNFYFWAAGQQATFRVTFGNNCGTTSYDFRFKSITCSNDPCSQFAVSPNPASTKIIVEVPNIPPPCGIGNPVPLERDDNQRNEVNIRSVILMDAQGQTQNAEQFFIDSKKTELDVSGLKKGLYILKISDGTRVENHHIVVE